MTETDGIVTLEIRNKTPKLDVFQTLMRFIDDIVTYLFATGCVKGAVISFEDLWLLMNSMGYSLGRIQRCLQEN